MYKAAVLQLVKNRMQEFFQQEVGNRVTNNNWSFLGLTLEGIFAENEVKEDIPEADKAKQAATMVT